MRIASPHRFLVTVLLLVGFLTAVGTAADRWIERQTLSTSTWVTTSSRLIADPAVRRAVADYTVRQAFTENGVDSALHDVLPGALADQVQNALQTTAGSTARSLLSTAAGRRAWRAANRQSQTELLTALDEPRRGHEAVRLDLSPLLRDLLAGLSRTRILRAIPGATAALGQVPTGRARLIILRPAQVRSLRGTAHLVRALAWALPATAILAFLLALLLAGGQRLRTFSRIGYRVLVAGVVVLAARPILRIPLGHLLVSSHENRVAVEAAWTIGTSVLHTEGLELLVAGAVLTLGSWGVRGFRRG